MRCNVQSVKQSNISFLTDIYPAAVHHQILHYDCRLFALFQPSTNYKLDLYKDTKCNSASSEIFPTVCEKVVLGNIFILTPNCRS